MRRIVGVAAIAAGLFLVAVPIATDLFDRTRGAERTFEAMHDLICSPSRALPLPAATSARSPQPARSSNGELIPGLAGRLDVTPEQFKALIARRYPDVATASERIPGYLMFVGPTIDALDENREEFEARRVAARGRAADHLGAVAVRDPRRAGRRGGRPRCCACRARARSRWSRCSGQPPSPCRSSSGTPSKASDARAVGDIARGGLSQQGADTAEEIVDRAREDGPAGARRDGAGHRAPARCDAVGSGGRARRATTPPSRCCWRDGRRSPRARRARSSQPRSRPWSTTSHRPTRRRCSSCRGW